MAYWRLKYGASFWWTPSEAELPPGWVRHAGLLGTQRSNKVTVYRECRAAKMCFICDLTMVRAELSTAGGVRVMPLNGVRPWPSSPPTEAIELSADE